MPDTPPTSGTRQRMIATGARLFARQGYRATSWRGLVRESGAPWGSIQHHFPGGKEELGVAALDAGAAAVGALIEGCLAPADSTVEGLRRWFAVSAELLEASDFQDGCPVATVALETASESAVLADASARAVTSWEDTVRRRLERDGIEAPLAGELATLVIATFEGALLLARIRRTTTPLAVAVDHLVARVEAARAG